MNHKRHQGFTLIEITIVVFIIGLIASIILISFNQVQIDSRDQRRTVDVEAMNNALNKYYSDNNEYPAVCPSGDNTPCDVSYLAGTLVPKYMPAVPSDPLSSQSYVYTRGPAANSSYGIRINYEAKSPCESGVRVDSTWWPSISVCSYM